MITIDEDEARLSIEMGNRAAGEYSRTKDAFARLKKAVFDEMLNLHPSDTQQLNRLLAVAQVADAVRDALLKDIADGEAAATLVKHLSDINEWNNQ